AALAPMPTGNSKAATTTWSIVVRMLIFDSGLRPPKPRLFFIAISSALLLPELGASSGVLAQRNVSDACLQPLSDGCLFIVGPRPIYSQCGHLARQSP